jgi:hypothetical protein
MPTSSRSGVIASGNSHGFAVPDDFRVTGFDDVGVSFLAQPALTTVRQPVSQMTNTIVDIVLASFGGDGQTAYVVRRFKPTLVIRDSSPAQHRLGPADQRDCDDERVEDGLPGLMGSAEQERAWRED